jgi:hypothetical protein
MVIDAEEFTSVSMDYSLSHFWLSFGIFFLIQYQVILGFHGYD